MTSPLSSIIDLARLEAFCRTHHVRAFRIFGSFAKGTATPASDIDVLIEFESGVDPDLFHLGGMQQDLTDLFGREVDLKTPEMFSPSNLQRAVSASVLAFAA